MKNSLNKKGHIGIVKIRHTNHGKSIIMMCEMNAEAYIPIFYRGVHDQQGVYNYIISATVIAIFSQNFQCEISSSVHSTL